MRPAHLAQRFHQLVARHPRRGEQRPRRGALLLGERDQQVLRGDVGVSQRLRLVLRAVEDLVQLAAERRLRAPARLRREPVQLARRALAQRREVEPRLLQQRHDDALGLVEQHREKVGVVDDRVAPAPRELRGVPESFLPLEGKSVCFDHGPFTGQRMCPQDAPNWQELRGLSPLSSLTTHDARPTTRDSRPTKREPPCQMTPFTLPRSAAEQSVFV